MSGDPYRHERSSPENDAALQRLAAEGRRRLQAASEAEGLGTATAERHAEDVRERNVRVQLGAYYGTPLRTAQFCLLGLGVLLFVVGMVFGTAGAATTAGQIWTWVAVAAIVVVTVDWVALVLKRPPASAARVATERAWASSLPFSMHGYFEMLGDEPLEACSLELDIAWLAGSPAEDLLVAVLGNWDAAARLQVRDGVAYVSGGPFKCGVRSDNDVSHYYWLRPTRDLVDRVHRLVELVLLPMHQSYAIGKVLLRHKEVDRKELR